MLLIALSGRWIKGERDADSECRGVILTRVPLLQIRAIKCQVCLKHLSTKRVIVLPDSVHIPDETHSFISES